MAEWNAPLPEPAVEGDPTHVEDHNLIVDALDEIRQEVDAVEGAVEGKADVAHAHSWDSVTDKPLTFTPATHAHAWADVTGKPATFPATAHTHPWGEVTGKPTSFAPAAHSHTVADTTGLQAALDGKQAAGSYAPASHTHTVANVTGLQSALDGKAATTHTHAISGVTGLQSALDAKASTAAVDGKVTGMNGITGLWAGTQAEYDALPSRLSTIAYIVMEGSATVAQDGFGRTLASSWGSADTGGAWTKSGTGTTPESVAGGAGVLDLNAATGVSMNLASTSLADGVSTVDYVAGGGPETGTLYAAFEARRTGALMYRLNVLHRPDGAVWLTIQRTDTSPGTLATVTSTGLTWEAGSAFHLKFEVSGTSPVSLRGKVWEGGTTEPAAWSIEHLDATPEAVTAAGSVGLYGYRSSGATERAPLSFDNFLVQNLGG